MRCWEAMLGGGRKQDEFSQICPTARISDATPTINKIDQQVKNKAPLGVAGAWNERWLMSQECS